MHSCNRAVLTISLLDDSGSLREPLPSEIKRLCLKSCSEQMKVIHKTRKDSWFLTEKMRSRGINDYTETLSAVERNLQLKEDVTFIYSSSCCSCPIVGFALLGFLDLARDVVILSFLATWAILGIPAENNFVGTSVALRQIRFIFC